MISYGKLHDHSLTVGSRRVASRAPEDGVDQEPPEAFVLKVLLHAQRRVKDTLAVALTRPSHRFRMAGNGALKKDRYVRGMGRIFIQFARSEWRDAGQYSVVLLIREQPDLTL